MSTTRAVLEFLTPYNIPGLLMERMGPLGDGGYVVPSALMRSATLLVTGGVADNLHFEADLARRVPSIRIALFDHTIDAVPDHSPAQANRFRRSPLQSSWTRRRIFSHGRLASQK